MKLSIKNYMEKNENCCNNLNKDIKRYIFKEGLELDVMDCSSLDMGAFLQNTIEPLLLRISKEEFLDNVSIMGNIKQKQQIGGAINYSQCVSNPETTIYKIIDLIYITPNVNDKLDLSKKVCDIILSEDEEKTNEYFYKHSKDLIQMILNTKILDNSNLTTISLENIKKELKLLKELKPLTQEIVTINTYKRLENNLSLINPKLSKCYGDLIEFIEIYKDASKTFNHLIKHSVEYIEDYQFGKLKIT